MHRLSDWSIGLGSWQGIPVRIHVLFVLFALVLVYFMTSTQTDVAGMAFYPWSIVVPAILLLSVVIHELGHLAAAAHVSADVEEIVIGPLGGMSEPFGPPEPSGKVLVAIAGPLANLIVAANGAMILAVWERPFQWEVFNPLVPSSLVEGPAGLVALRLTIWVNWLLAILNLLPTFPFDGAKAWRAAVASVAGNRSAAVYVARFGYIVAGSLGVAAWLVASYTSPSLVPAWLPLAAMAVLVGFSAHRDAHQPASQDWDDGWLDDDPELDDLIASFDSGEDSWDDGVLVEQSYEDLARGSYSNRDCTEVIDEARLDDILAKLHNSSLDRLSPQDREILKKASEEFRSRRKRNDGDTI